MGRGVKGEWLSSIRDGLGDNGSSLAPSSCPNVAVVGGVWGVTTSERRGDLILGFSPSIASLEGVWGDRPPSSCEEGRGEGRGGEGKGERREGKRQYVGEAAVLHK